MIPDCEPGCTCRGRQTEAEVGPQCSIPELTRLLRDASSQRVRLNLIAHHTCDQVECPHCYARVGEPCVTFPRGTPAVFPHMRRVNLRRAQISVPT